MKELTQLMLKLWLIPASIMSIFWGLRSVCLFTKDSPSLFKNKVPWIGKFWIGSYQFISNFVGSFAGWCCLYVLLIRLQSNYPNLDYINLMDLFLFIFSLLGLAGHLPELIVGFVGSFSKIIEALIKKIT